MTKNGKKKKSEKIGKIVNLILTPIFVIGMTLCVVISFSYIYKNMCIESIFISGGSMEPTLIGGNKNGAINGDIVDYGSVSVTKHSINNLKNFDIITCYYPWRDYVLGDKEVYEKGDKLKENKTYKVKRIIGLPNQTIEIYKSNIRIDNTWYTDDGTDKDLIGYINFNESYTVLKLPYEREFDSFPKDGFNLKERKLGDDRYFVMGDHWGSSEDCYTNTEKYPEGIYRINIHGKLLSIDGTATYISYYQCPSCKRKFEKSLGYQNRCTCKANSILVSKSDIINKKKNKEIKF